MDIFGKDACVAAYALIVSAFLSKKAVFLLKSVVKQMQQQIIRCQRKEGQRAHQGFVVNPLRQQPHEEKEQKKW